MTAKAKSPEDRKKRLARALKANIARRKAQARKRQSPEKAEQPEKV